MKDAIIENARKFHGLEIGLPEIGWIKAQVGHRTLDFMPLYSFLGNRHQVAAVRFRGRWIGVVIDSHGIVKTIFHPSRLRPFRSLLRQRPRRGAA